MERRLLCRLGKHSWIRKFTDDGHPYIGCKHCEATNSSDAASPGGGLPVIGGG